MLLLLIAAQMALGASAVLGGIDIVGSSRGLALTFSADAPFTTSATEKPSNKTGIASVLSIKCSQVIYGLEEFTFTSFPTGSVVKHIAINESAASGTIELLISLSIKPDKNILAKQKGNKWIILVTQQPVEPFSWNPGIAAHSQPAVQVSVPSISPKAEEPKPAKLAPIATTTDNGQSRLVDVTLAIRDKLEQVTFMFDRTTSMKLKRDSDKIIILFINTNNTLPDSRLIPPSTSIASIDLKQMTHGGTMWLGATLVMKQGKSKSTLMQAFSDRLVLFTAVDSVERFASWSAKTKKAATYNFVTLPHLDIDLKSIEKKAKSELDANVKGAQTFAISDAPPKGPTAKTSQPQVAAVPVPPKPIVAPLTKKQTAKTVFVTKNNVNLRKGPSATDSIVAKLAFGMTCLQTDTKPGWVKVKVSEGEGWIASAMVVDSAKATKELLQKISSEQKRLLAQKQAAEKKSLAEAEKKKILGEEQLKQAGKKQQAEDDALAKKAMKRDSIMHYMTVVQDSMEKAKKASEKKLVEYHIYGRDPFVPLSQQNDSLIASIDELKLVGILFDDVDRLALCESKQDKSRSFVFRENDPIQSGYVLRILPDKVMFLINELGISRTYALKLSKTKE
jgi:hypothetical protein